MKDLLCKAFCASLDVRTVPVGYVVRTPYDNADGDPLLVYFVREGRSWRLEDDGTQVPWLEANGVDIGGKSRAAAFSSLLTEYGATFDYDRRTLASEPLDEDEVGAAAVRFVGLLLRLQDLALLSPQTVRNTWREDALAALHIAFDGVAALSESASLSPDMKGYDADIVVQPPSGPPMAIYLGTSEEKALQAIIAKMEAEKYRGIAAKVALMVEKSKSNPVKEATYSLAMARLDTVVSFREAKEDTMQRLGQVVGVTANIRRFQ